jgi:hypothetical protein
MKFILIAFTALLTTALAAPRQQALATPPQHTLAALEDVLEELEDALGALDCRAKGGEYSAHYACADRS